ncbi:MAG: hypothetical protein J6S27_02430, partial [Thermoguttaceae bacterium]|nr:hypothetical protein [Thermoguttaceae bacterium]
MDDQSLSRNQIILPIRGDRTIPLFEDILKRLQIPSLHFQGNLRGKFPSVPPIKELQGGLSIKHMLKESILVMLQAMVT